MESGRSNHSGRISSVLQNSVNLLDDSSTRPADVLDWLSFIIVSFEHFNLESVIGALLEVKDSSTWDQVRTDPCFFLSRGKVRSITRVG